MTSKPKSGKCGSVPKATNKALVRRLETPNDRACCSKYTLVTHTTQPQAKTADRSRVGRRPIASGHRLAVHGPTIDTYNRRTYIARTTAYSSAGLPARCVRAEHTPPAPESRLRPLQLPARRRHACLTASPRPHKEAPSAASTSAPLPLLPHSPPVEPPAARAVQVVDLWVPCTPHEAAVPAQTAGPTSIGRPRTA